MTKLFVIAGHGAGDPGACAGGHSEAALVRMLAVRIADIGGSDVKLGDMSVNWYRENYIGKGKCPKGVPVLELHLDSSTSASAKGGHVIIHGAYSPDRYDNALADFISEEFPGRAQSIVKRTDLLNAKRAASMGVNYRLLECCFISNASDRRKLIDQMDAVARGILRAFGIDAGEASRLPYVVSVTADVLNVRSGPGTSHGISAQVRRGEAYTITAERSGWGRLKSGAGWISLKHTRKV